MDFFDKLGKTLTEAGKTVADTTKNVTDVAKMKMEVKSKEDFIDRQLMEIGKKVYEAEKDAESSAFEEVFAIKQTYVEIEDLKNEILAAKGYKKCPKCGANMNPDAKFCPSCGAASEDEE